MSFDIFMKNETDKTAAFFFFYSRFMIGILKFLYIGILYTCVSYTIYVLISMYGTSILYIHIYEYAVSHEITNKWEWHL